MIRDVQKLTQQKGGSKMQELAGSESKLHHATCNNCTNNHVSISMTWNSTLEYLS